VLVSSNPTNLVLSGAFNISFIQYTAHVILPFLAAAIAIYPVLRYALYNSDTLIPKELHGEFDTVEESGGTLIDKHGAIFGGVLLLITLAVLVGTSTVGVPVWQVTVPPAIILLLRDGIHDWRSHVRARSNNGGKIHEPARGENEYPLEELHDENSIATPDVSRSTSDIGIPSSPSLSAAHDPSREALFSIFRRWESAVSSRFPTVTTIARRLPVPLIPFAFLMFILVQALSAEGWVEVLAHWWSAWVEKTGTIGAIGGMAFVSCIMCNVCLHWHYLLLPPALTFTDLCADMRYKYRRNNPASPYTASLDFILGRQRAHARRRRLRSCPRLQLRRVFADLLSLARGPSMETDTQTERDTRPRAPVSAAQLTDDLCRDARLDGCVGRTGVHLAQELARMIKEIVTRRSSW
jgi:hypothetical protein